MKLLILGGTRFVGRHLVAAALSRNHEVTLFNRGHHKANPREAPDSPVVETIHGDRNSDLDKLTGRRWDVVIDTWGYLPRTVKASAETLAPLTGTYVFVSSVSAYADFSVPGIDESAPLATLSSEQIDEANAIDASGESSAVNYGKLYGGLKALCEQEVQNAFPNAHLIIRPGLIVGPYDYSDRFTYWVKRVAAGGEVLAPGRPEHGVQFIDARDLAEWIVLMIERQHSGVYNANGPAGKMTTASVLEEINSTTKSDALFTWVSEEFLMQEQVAAWSELPLWLPEEAAPHMRGFMFVTCEKAIASGLKFRPLTETFADTLAWCRTVGSSEPLLAGLDRDKENALLRKWHEQDRRT
jgi:2'-hydroxyisoflavone reductase